VSLRVSSVNLCVIIYYTQKRKFRGAVKTIIYDTTVGKTQLNLSEFPAGIYVVKVIDNTVMAVRK